MHTAAFVFEYDDTEAAALVAAAVGQEVGEIGGDRTTTRIDRDDTELRVEIEADDLVALRAGLNTWTTLVDVAERSIAR